MITQSVALFDWRPIQLDYDEASEVLDAASGRALRWVKRAWVVKNVGEELWWRVAEEQVQRARAEFVDPSESFTAKQLRQIWWIVGLGNGVVPLPNSATAGERGAHKSNAIRSLEAIYDAPESAPEKTSSPTKSRSPWSLTTRDERRREKPTRAHTIFTNWYTEYRQDALQLATTVSRSSPLDYDEALQVALAAAWKASNRYFDLRFDPRLVFRSYVRTTMLRSLIDEQRRAGKHLACSAPLSSLDETEACDETDPPDPTADPAELVEHRDGLDRLLEILGSMPNGVLLVKRALLGFSYAELAAQEGSTPSAIERRCQRAATRAREVRL